MSRVRLSNRCGLAVLISVVLAASTPLTFANEQVFDETVHSSAWIVSPFKEDDYNGKVETGTAAVVDLKEGLLVTAYHVVQERKHLMVFFPQFQNGKLVTSLDAYTDEFRANGIAADVVYTDSKLDLALVKVPHIPASVTQFKLGQLPTPGQTLFEVGNSSIDEGYLWRFGSGMVRGVLSHHDTAITSPEVQKLCADMIETQIPVNGGDSGGPVVDDKGRLVGITSHHIVEMQLVSFMIAVDEVQHVLDSYRSGDEPVDASTLAELRAMVQKNQQSLKTPPAGANLDSPLSGPRYNSELKPSPFEAPAIQKPQPRMSFQQLMDEINRK